MFYVSIVSFQCNYYINIYHSYYNITITKATGTLRVSRVLEWLPVPVPVGTPTRDPCGLPVPVSFTNYIASVHHRSL